MTLSRFLPFLRWPRPSLAMVRADGWAGITVGLVLLPQAIAYATLAGMPPQTGLYAALVPAVIGILFGSSQLLSVGPVALTSMLVFGSLARLATPGSPEWVELAIWLALYSGAIQLAMGALSLGRIANLVSQPVITGFINAAAVLIILSQLPALTGLALAADWDMRLLQSQPSWSLLVTAAFGGCALLLLLAFKRYAPRWPGILIVTLLGILASMLLDYAALGGAIVGPIPSGLPLPTLPATISFERHQELWPSALILALISFTEAMSSCRVLARKRNEQWDEDQELIGQGLAKLSSGLFGAFPVSGSFSRSALNLYAGAVSGWSTLVATVCVAIGLLFLTEWVAYLPRAVLAALIVVPVFGLIDIKGMRRLFTISRHDGAIAVMTLLVTLFSAPRLHWGVFAGVGLTMAVYLYRHTRPRVIVVSLHPNGNLRDRARFSLPPLAPDTLAIRLDAALNFLTAAALERFISRQLQQQPEVRRLLLCAGGINSIDASGIETLEAIHSNLLKSGIVLQMSGIKKQVCDVMEAAGLLQRIGWQNIYATDAQAVAAIRCAQAETRTETRTETAAKQE